MGAWRPIRFWHGWIDGPRMIGSWGASAQVGRVRSLIP